MGYIGQNPRDSDACSAFNVRYAFRGVPSPTGPLELYPTQSWAWPAYLVGFLLANYLDFNCRNDSR